MDEIAGGSGFFPFDLKLQELKRSVQGAAYEKSICHDARLCRRQRTGTNASLQYLKILSPKSRIGSGPRLKSAHTVEDFRGGSREIHEAVFFLEDGSEARLGVVLRPGLNRASLQAAQGFDDEIGTDCGEVRRESLGRVVGPDRKFLLQQDVARVESRVKTHRGHAGDSFTFCDGPLNRRRTAVFRQEGRVKVDVAEPREIQHPLRDEAAVTNHNDSLGLESGDLGAEFFVGLDALRLGDGEIEFQCRLFDRRRHDFKAATLRAVGLSHDEMHAESGSSQLFEGGYSETWRAAKREIQGHCVVE